MNAHLSCCLATLALCAAPAAACDAVAGEGGTALATTVFVAGGAGEGGDVVEWSQQHSLEVRRSADGELEVVIDGKPVPVDRIRHEGDRVVIVDEEGKEHPLFGLLMGERGRHGAFALRLGGAAGAEPFALNWDNVKYEPKVMLGIHLDRPGAALEKHLGLEAGATTMISGLYKGLPADAAGLELYDIITAIDGKAPADPGALTEALSQHEPGDVLTFSVVQSGKARTVRVTAEAYDRNRMEAAELEGAPSVQWFGHALRPGTDLGDVLVDPDKNAWFFQWDSGRIQDQIREHLKSFEEKAGKGLDNRLENLNDRIDELREMLDELVERAKELTRDAGEDR